MRAEETFPAREADADAPPGVARPLAWLGLMILLVGGFAMMGAAFTGDNGVVFVAGLLVSGLAFLIPLAGGPRHR